MPSGVELRPASAFSAAELAAAFTAGYAGYQFPISLDAATFSRYATLWDYDLGRSRVAVDGDAAVGFAMLGVRDRRGWIGGMGVVEAARGTGVGRALLEAVLGEACAGGLDEVSLEVLEGNDAAIGLYESVGFERTRMLELWLLREPVEEGSAAPIGVAEAHELIRRLRQEPEPWQRADETLAHLVESETTVEAFGVGDEGAAIATPGHSVSMFQLATTRRDTARSLLLAALRRGDSLSFVNVPEGSATAAAFRELGGRLAGRQHEMALRPVS